MVFGARLGTVTEVAEDSIVIGASVREVPLAEQERA